MTKNAKFPLYFPIDADKNYQGIKIVTIELNQNYITVAYFDTKQMGLTLLSKETYHTKDFQKVSEVYQYFISDKDIKHVDKVSIIVPGPIINDEVFSEHLDWTINLETLKSNIGINDVYLINDLEAYAYGLVDYSEEDLTPINTSDVSMNGNVAVLSAGNGLGEAGLFYDGKYLRPFATEGGHSEFSPRTNVEVQFYQYLHRIYGIVSWELVLSKKGLFNIFRFLRDEQGHCPSQRLVEKINEMGFEKALYDEAMNGGEDICSITINTFLEFLAREANSLVLKLKATGGLIITGELTRIFQDYIDRQRFYKKFLTSDKMERLLKNIPIYLATEEELALKGATYFAAYR